MVNQIIDNTISAICVSLVREKAGVDALSNGRLNSVELFVRSQVYEMPDYLRWAFKTVIMLFVTIVFLSHGRTFCRLMPDTRRLILARWRIARIGVKQDFVRLFDTLVLYGLAEQEYLAS